MDFTGKVALITGTQLMLDGGRSGAGGAPPPVR